MGWGTGGCFGRRVRWGRRAGKGLVKHVLEIGRDDRRWIGRWVGHTNRNASGTCDNEFPVRFSFCNPSRSMARRALKLRCKPILKPNDNRSATGAHPKDPKPKNNH